MYVPLHVQYVPQTVFKVIFTKLLILTLGIGDGSGRSLVASSLKTEEELVNASSLIKSEF